MGMGMRPDSNPAGNPGMRPNMQPGMGGQVFLAYFECTMIHFYIFKPLQLSNVNVSHIFSLRS